MINRNNHLKIFENSAFGRVRSMIVDDNPWFVANDVASVLGYQEPKKAIKRHCKKVNKIKGCVSSSLENPNENNILTFPFGDVDINIIPKPDMYSLNILAFCDIVFVSW